MSPTREKKMREAALQTQLDLTVVLENIYDPLNISAIMRSCDAVGIREIFVIYTQQYLDKRGLVLGKRTSAGTFKWMDVYLFDNMEECFKRVRTKYKRVLATLPSEGSHSLFNLDLTIPTAIIFGNEDDGLSTEAIALCDGFFTIPQAGFAESLNISVACAVSLYEAYRQRSSKGFYSTHPQLDTFEQEALFQRWAKKVKTDKYHNRGIAIDEQSPDIIPVFAARPSLT
jgi:tRNA (guanosine-2'-O-)-methyltransferase